MAKEIEAANEILSVGAKSLKLHEMKEFQSWYRTSVKNEGICRHFY